jgi:hypothetical protein
MATITWSSSSSGNWSTAADWSTGAAPTINDAAIIEAGSGVTVTVNDDEAAGSLTTSGSTLAVTAGIFTVGHADLNGAYVQSGGDTELAGNGTFASGLTQTGGLLHSTGGQLDVTGALTEAGGDLRIDSNSGGTLAGDTSLTSGTIEVIYGQLAIDNSFNQSGGVLDAGDQGVNVAANFVQTGGKIQLKEAPLIFQGPNVSIAGSIAGVGQVDVYSGITTLQQGALINVSLIDVYHQGTLVLGSNFTAGKSFEVGSGGTLTLGGNTLTTTGRAVFGGVIGGGVVNAAGGGRLLDNLVINNNALLNIGSAFSLDGNLNLAAQLDIGSGASLTLTGNDAIGGSNNVAGTLTNAGLLSKTGGGGIAEITDSVTSPGSIAIGHGTIDFDGLTNNFSGSISGTAGHVTFGADNQGGSTDTFESGMTLSTGSALIGGNNTTVFLAENLTYAGNWQESGGTLYLDGNLTLNGTSAFDGGLIKGASTLTAHGLVNLGGIDIEGDTHSNFTSKVIESSSITLGNQSGSAPTLTIAAGATMLLEGAANITGADGTLIDNGAITKTGGAALISDSGTLTMDNGSVLTIQSGTLASTGDANLLGGTVTGIGVLDLEGASTLGTRLTLGVGQLMIDGQNGATTALAGNISFANAFSHDSGTLALGGNTLTLSGNVSLDGGTLTGLGSLVTTSAAALGDYTVGGQATLVLAAGGEQTGAALTIEADSQLTVSAGTTYTLDDSFSMAGGGTLAVAGTLADNGLLFGTISPSVVDTGMISAGAGELSFLGAVTGSGTIAASANGQLDFGQSTSVSAGLHVNIGAGNTSLLLENASAFDATIAGFTTGDFIEISGLRSGYIPPVVWSNNNTTAQISDSSGDTFTLNFASSVSTAHVSIGDGPHGYIGIGYS